MSKSLFSIILCLLILVHNAQAKVDYLEGVLVGMSSYGWSAAKSAASAGSKMYERVKNSEINKYMLKRVIENSPSFEKVLETAGTAASGLLLVKTAKEMIEDCIHGECLESTAKKSAQMVLASQGSVLGAAVGTMVFPGVGTYLGSVIGGIGGEIVADKVAEKVKQEL